MSIELTSEATEAVSRLQNLRQNGGLRHDVKLDGTRLMTMIGSMGPLPMPGLRVHLDQSLGIEWVDRGLYVEVEGAAIIVSHFLHADDVWNDRAFENQSLKFTGDARIETAAKLASEILSKETQLYRVTHMSIELTLDNPEATEAISRRLEHLKKNGGLQQNAELDGTRLLTMLGSMGPLPMPGLSTFDDQTLALAWADRGLFLNVEDDAITVSHILHGEHVWNDRDSVEFRGNGRIETAAKVAYEILSQKKPDVK